LWNEKHSDTYDGAQAISAVSRIIDRAAAEGNTPDAFSQIKERKRNRRRTGLVLASVVVVLCAGWYFMQQKESHISARPQQEPIVANNGSRSRSLLPDGTTVWLNAGSRLYYVNNFNGSTREVRLEGEAFFDVVKQTGRPFIVHTAGIDIRVTGTAFNVKSYPEDKNVETTLYRGSVQVSRQEDETEEIIELRPNEKLILAKDAAKNDAGLSYRDTPPSNRDTADFIKTHIDSNITESERFETAWLYSRLEFRGINFEELAHKLERWYNVTIDFADEEVKNLNFNGSFEKENVEQAFEALRVAVPAFDYRIENQQVVISSLHRMPDAKK
jgi:transmembrane sensor